MNIDYPFNPSYVGPSAPAYESRKKMTVLGETVLCIALSALCFLAAEITKYDFPVLSHVFRLIPVGIAIFWLIRRIAGSTNSDDSDVVYEVRSSQQRPKVKKEVVYVAPPVIDPSSPYYMYQAPHTPQGYGYGRIQAVHTPPTDSGFNQPPTMRVAPETR